MKRNTLLLKVLKLALGVAFPIFKLGLEFKIVLLELQFVVLKSWLVLLLSSLKLSCNGKGTLKATETSIFAIIPG